MEEQKKRSFLKTWWFWTLVVVLVIVIANIGDKGLGKNQDTTTLVSNETNQIATNPSATSDNGAMPNTTIDGAYKLTNTKELMQNYSVPGFAGNAGTSFSLLAVKGTLKGIFPENDTSTYDLVINTGDGVVVVMQGTIDPNTQASNGFMSSNFSVGDKITSTGVFAGNSNDITLKTLIDIDPQLINLSLPANTPILVSKGINGVKHQ